MRNPTHLGIALVVATYAASIPTTRSFESYTNPILPGFHPDPSCIFVPEHNSTFFCVTSSFYAFPGLPIFASQDLTTWTQISTALSRPEQLPALATTNRSTGGIWAPTLRYHADTFYISTTLVFDDLPKNDTSRWDNVILSTTNPYASNWSDPVHFAFPGYDPSLFWDDDGTVYVTGAHSWNVWPGFLSAAIGLTSGALGPFHNPWNGTGGLAPEGPHIYKHPTGRDGENSQDSYYYLVAAEGGTGENHMVTMARSKHIHGPYEPAARNPLLSNANSSAYFQAIGHVDLFQDGLGQWWAAGLSVRSGPEVLSYPMGRETFLTPVAWPDEHTGANGDDTFPVFTPVKGRVELTDGRTLPCPSCRPASSYDRDSNDNIAIPPPTDSQHSFTVGSDDSLTFPPSSTLPPHFIHYRLPIASNYAISPSNTHHANTLQLTASTLNLTAYDGFFTGGRGQTFIGRRQEHSLFVFSVDLDYSGLAEVEDEAGVTLFVVQRYHFDLGVVLLPSSSSTMASEDGDKGVDSEADGGEGPSMPPLTPYLRFRGMSGDDANETALVPLATLDPNADRTGGAAAAAQKVRLQIEAVNATHFAFSAGVLRPDAMEDTSTAISSDSAVEMTTMGHCMGSQLSWGFTGTVVGVYATTNGREGDGVDDNGNGNDRGAFDAWFGRWTYRGLRQIVE